MIPATTPEILRQLDRRSAGSRSAQLELCHPDVNPYAAAYFITRFCKTLDEERPGEISTIADYPFVLRMIDFLEANRLERYNGLIDKSRRMLGTWTACAFMLWRSQHVRGFPAFATTGKGGDYVDDGGDHSTPKSVFGRFRFMWDRLPDHVKRQTNFAFKRVVCEEMNAYISGESPTEQGGRAGGYAMALVDEAAFVEHSEALHRALDPACRDGRLYISTANGPQNAFAWILKKRPKNWRIHVLDWTEHPLLNGGIEDTPEPEVERFGARVSPRFREITASLRDEDIASEYLHSLERSMKGLVFKEFHVRRHVPDDPIALNPALPVKVGVDYASTGWGTAAIGQLVAPRQVDVIADYELEGAGDVLTHARNIAEVLRSVGYQGPLEKVEIVGGPDTSIRNSGGQTIAGFFHSVGFTWIHESKIRGSDSVDRGIAFCCSALRRGFVRVSPRCERLIARFPEYRWSVDRFGVVRKTKPVPNDAEDMMDAFRYLITDTLPDDVGSFREDTFDMPATIAAAAVDDRIDLGGQDRFGFDDEDDRVRPIGGLIGPRGFYAAS